MSQRGKLVNQILLIWKLDLSKTELFECRTGEDEAEGESNVREMEFGEI